MSLAARISSHGWQIYLSEIVAAAREDVARLADAEARPVVFELGEREQVSCLIAPGPAGNSDPLVIATAMLPRELLDQLDPRRPAEVPDGRTLFGARAPAAQALILPLVVHGELAGAIALLNAPAASPQLRQRLESLAAQVSVALEGAELTATILRRETEARFSALAQHSSDVILVLDPDTTVQYASPSVEQMLSYDAAELLGQRLSDYIPAQDVAVVQDVIASAPSASAGSSEALELTLNVA
jgi:PAS domain-containing protein